MMMLQRTFSHSFFIVGLSFVMMSATLSYAQERFTFVPEISAQGQLGSSLCACPRHQASGINGVAQGLGITGIMVLDSLPQNSAIITTVRYDIPLSENEGENSGYKKFFSLLQLKQLASIHGANALIQVVEKRDTAKKILTFEALAVRVVR